MNEITINQDNRVSFRDDLGRTLHLFRVVSGIVLHIDDADGDITHSQAVVIDDETVELLAIAIKRIGAVSDRVE